MRLWPSLGALCAALMFSAPASADTKTDVAKVVYQEAKEIITDLITLEAVKTSGVALVCSAPDVIPALFPKVSASLMKGRLEEISSLLEEETKRVLIEYTYWAIGQASIGEKTTFNNYVKTLSISTVKQYCEPADDGIVTNRILIIKEIEKLTREDFICNNEYIDHHVAIKCEMAYLVGSYFLGSKTSIIEHYSGMLAAAINSNKDDYYKRWMILKGICLDLILDDKAEISGDSIGKVTGVKLGEFDLNLMKTMVSRARAIAKDIPDDKVLGELISGVIALAGKLAFDERFSFDKVDIVSILNLSSNKVRTRLLQVALKGSVVNGFSMNGVVNDVFSNVAMSVLNYLSKTTTTAEFEIEMKKLAKNTLIDLISNTDGGYLDSDSESKWGGEWATFSIGAAMGHAFQYTGEDKYRPQFNADGLVLKLHVHRSRLWYAGVHGSLINLMAPFSEMAYQDEEKYEYKKTIKCWVNAIQPRIEFVFGVPVLSQKLAVYAGVGYVPAAVEPIDETDGDGNGTNTKQTDANTQPKSEPIEATYGFGADRYHWLMGAGVRLFPF